MNDGGRSLAIDIHARTLAHGSEGPWSNDAVGAGPPPFHRRVRNWRTEIFGLRRGRNRSRNQRRINTGHSRI
jgi:hypothetical protein